jgi:hypothetical protein
VLAASISTNINLSLAADLDQLQNFEGCFINPGIDDELDKRMLTLQESESKLNAITCYLSALIENKEKKNGKSSDYVKIHETEKNNFSLVSTGRRCKLLLEALPSEQTTISLVYDDAMNKTFEFKISKKQFSFEKQSSSNNFIFISFIIKFVYYKSSIFNIFIFGLFTNA